MLILNPDLDFRNFDAKVHFRANLGPNSQSCPFHLKIGTHGISSILIPNPDLGSKLPDLSENWYKQYLKDADSESRLRFLKF